MIRNERRLRLCKTMLVLILAFIWGNSLLPATSSLSFSEWVRMLLTNSTPVAYGEVNWRSALIRKMAHFLEFGGLGFFMAWHHGMLGKRLMRAFGLCAAAACIDETIQFFVPGRGPGLYDVAIDTLGAAAGILLLYFGHTYLKKRSTKQILEDN